MKIDLGEAEAEMPKTHEVGFDMSLHQVKYFFKDADCDILEISTRNFVNDAFWIIIYISIIQCIYIYSW